MSKLRKYKFLAQSVDAAVLGEALLLAPMRALDFVN